MNTQWAGLSTPAVGAGDAQVRYPADTLQNVTTGDPEVASAPLAGGGHQYRVFNDLTDTAVKMDEEVPSNAVGLVITLEYRVETAPGVTKVVRWDAYGQEHEEGSASSGWSAGVANDIAIGTTAARPEEVALTYTLAELSLIQGAPCQIVLSRQATHVNDDLPDGFHLYAPRVRWF